MCLSFTNSENVFFKLCGKTHDDESLVICDICDLAFGMQCIYPALAPGSESNFICGTCVHCPDCKGSGDSGDGTCSSCNGKGII